MPSSVGCCTYLSSWRSSARPAVDQVSCERDESSPTNTTSLSSSDWFQDEDLVRKYKERNLFEQVNQYPMLGGDPHLLLGMKRSSIVELHDEIMKGYDRQAHFSGLGKDDWITATYGASVTGYDFAEATKDWLFVNGEALSPAEVALKQDSNGVGVSSCFISHTQREPLPDTLMMAGASCTVVCAGPLDIETKYLGGWVCGEILEGSVFAKAGVKPGYSLTAINGGPFDIPSLQDCETSGESYTVTCQSFSLKEFPVPPDENLWLDIAILRQRRRNFDTDKIELIIRTVGKTLALEDSDETYFKRSFCLFEIACTLRAGGELLVPVNASRFALHNLLDVSCYAVVNCQEANARDLVDKAMIDKFIIEHAGGFEQVNTAISKALSLANVVS